MTSKDLSIKKKLKKGQQSNSINQRESQNSVYEPEQTPLSYIKRDRTDSEIEYEQKTSELKNYLRKKTIHASIFKQSASLFDKEVTVTQTTRG